MKLPPTFYLTIQAYIEHDLLKKFKKLFLLYRIFLNTETFAYKNKL